MTEEERKQRHRESCKRYKETHKDKIKEYSKAYNKKRYWELKKEKRVEHNAKERERYHKLKDSINEKKRKRYNDDVEYRKSVLDKNAKYKAENPDFMKMYRESHKEELAAYDKEYYQKYKETQLGRATNLVSSYKQNDKLKNRGECTIDRQWIVDNIFTKHCEYCGETDWHELGCDRKDNSLPHTPENCVPCCLSCNSKKGKMSYDEYKKMLAEQPC